MAFMTGDKLLIEGLAGRRLASGTIRINGSKNDAVQAIAAAALFRGGLILNNLPDIADIGQMLLLLENLGATTKRAKRRVQISLPARITNPALKLEIAKKIRASILLTGPILARYGSAIFPHPGGCVIGQRPIDFFLNGFAQMGATIKEIGPEYHLVVPGKRLRGATIFFKNQSVTATATFLMAATLARGQTILKNCALEPEIINLIEFLVLAGAKITGVGTHTLVIRGGQLLKTARPYRVLPDRIEAGSFAILGALTNRRFSLTHCRPEHLGSLWQIFSELGLRVTSRGSSVTITRTGSTFRPVQLKTHEYPGFPTDLQAPLAVLLTQATGESSVFETIFEGRVSYAETLVKMGAKIKIINPHQLTITGPTPLVGRAVASPDLRAGLAYILAGLVARGETVVHNVHYVDRGYEGIDERLRGLGFKVKRF